MHCPKCNTNLEGELIYKTFLRKYEGDKVRALETAANYGATQRKGRWGRAIGIFCQNTDRVIAWRCLNCKHQWPRT